MSARPTYPNFQALVEARGGYHLVTDADWIEHLKQVEAWRADYLAGLPVAKPRRDDQPKLRSRP